MKAVLDFLSDLKKNNNKEWMDSNKSRYQAVKKEFENLVRVVIEQISQFDTSIAGIEPKNCIFRLNRDIRFSNDKRPYKENMGAFITKDGKKGVDGGYYIHIQPGQSMLAGGTYMPPADILKKIRQEIDYNPKQLEHFMHSRDFKKYFGRFEGERLKTAPKGYPADHPRIDLLNLKSLIVAHNIEDKLVLDNNFTEYAIKIFSAMKPLNDYLKTAINE